MKLSLYNLTDDFNKLMDAEGDDITDALIEMVAGEIEVKAESYCKLLAVLDTTIDQFKAEEMRISSARKAMENKVERVREYMKEALLNANIDKLKCGTFSVSVGLSPGSVSIDQSEIIPARFLTVIPEQYVPDKAAIKAAIKEGQEVPGAHIEAGYTLRIR